MQTSLDQSKMPAHVAIIMDGNRRWAVEHEMPYIGGHKEALVRVEEIIEYSAQIGVTHLTLWAWSTKNWKRNADFVKDSIELFRQSLGPNGSFQRSIEKGAKLHHIGKLDGFPDDVQAMLKKYMLKDPVEKKIDVNVAIGYEGRDELVRAYKRMIGEGVSDNDITLEKISSYTDTAGQPDVDFLIRTGGERRTSGFLIWQAADAELYFTDTYMPDFDVRQYQKALADYATRERRMGGDSKKY